MIGAYVNLRRKTLTNAHNSLIMILEARSNPDWEILFRNSPFCRKVGFTPTRFEGYLTKSEEHNTVILSLVYSLQPHKRHLLNVLKMIRELGYNMVAYTCSTRMDKILTQFGFIRSFDNGDPCLFYDNSCFLSKAHEANCEEEEYFQEEAAQIVANLETVFY